MHPVEHRACVALPPFHRHERREALALLLLAETLRFRLSVGGDDGLGDFAIGGEALPLLEWRHRCERLGDQLRGTCTVRIDRCRNPAHHGRASLRQSRALSRALRSALWQGDQLLQLPLRGQSRAIDRHTCSLKSTEDVFEREEVGRLLLLLSIRVAFAVSSPRDGSVVRGSDALLVEARDYSLTRERCWLLTRQV